jgi:hypothetical protein
LQEATVSRLRSWSIQQADLHSKQPATHSSSTAVLLLLPHSAAAYRTCRRPPSTACAAGAAPKQIYAASCLP